MRLCVQLPSSEEIPLPPIILGRLGSDPGKKTVCIYGHLDVQPASIDDGWDTEPFTLVEKDGESRAVSVSVDTKPFFVWPGMIFRVKSDFKSRGKCQTSCVKTSSRSLLPVFRGALNHFVFFFIYFANC